MIDVKKFLPLFCFGGLVAVCAGLPAATARADVKAGVDAWTDGDYGAAVKEWTPLAQRGDADAQFNLAQAYKMGRGVPLDMDKAKDLYRKAAAQGHLQAADLYGLLLFQDGEREKAMPYIRASAARGFSSAQYILGLAHFNGDLADKDWVRAYALVNLAREAGMAQAARALTQMDAFIPLADRQKSVILSAQMAAEAKATRERLAAAAELGGAPQPAVATTAAPASRPGAGTGRAGMAGADYARPAPSPLTAPVPPSPAPALPRTAAPAIARPAAGPWRAQLGAFGVTANAEALWARVKSRPELSGHGKLLVPAGRLTKLQAAGFATRTEADAACARLTAGGFTCLAVRE